ncbi:hypothetical protein B0H16DRAFT_1448689 [Mycena metata]|uniref:MFS general substrate transporter n=1 Tax=Mycena metata TaxID=1033252 RepID=A0AAD7NXE7_9AGAR|nr:hypothetical protein B0H16DRAFT_1448689 [Mycena metata]
MIDLSHEKLPNAGIEKTGDYRSDQLLLYKAHQEGIKPIFLAKVKVLNDAIAECGLGRYARSPPTTASQRCWGSRGVLPLLNLVTDFVWFADNIWLQAIAILMPAIANQLNNIRMATFALYCGLIVGGMTCDVIGRRTAWNATLFISGIFGVAWVKSERAWPYRVGEFIGIHYGHARSLFNKCRRLTQFCNSVRHACLYRFGVGGNLPVDGALFLEFPPGKDQYLLTLLSAWFLDILDIPGQILLRHHLVGKLVLPDGSLYQCDNTNNNGWRYSYYTMGAIMLFLGILRVFFFPMDESPKFLVTAAPYLDPDAASLDGVPMTKFSTWALIRNSFDHVSGENIKGLFCTPRLAYSSGLIIYAALGLAYPLFNAFLGSYLSTRETDTGATGIDATYSAYTYQAVCGVGGSLLAAVMVQWSRTGRKYSLAFFTLMSGVFLFALTFDHEFLGDAFYGCCTDMHRKSSPLPAVGQAMPWLQPPVGLLAYLPLRTIHRGSSFEPDVWKVIAVDSNAGKTPTGPVYASAGIFVLTGLVMLGLPIETVYAEHGPKPGGDGSSQFHTTSIIDSMSPRPVYAGYSDVSDASSSVANLGGRSTNGYIGLPLEQSLIGTRLRASNANNPPQTKQEGMRKAKKKILNVAESRPFVGLQALEHSWFNCDPAFRKLAKFNRSMVDFKLVGYTTLTGVGP